MTTPDPAGTGPLPEKTPATPDDATSTYEPPSEAPAGETPWAASDAAGTPWPPAEGSAPWPATDAAPDASADATSTAPSVPPASPAPPQGSVPPAAAYPQPSPVPPWPDPMPTGPGAAPLSSAAPPQGSVPPTGPTPSPAGSVPPGAGAPPSWAWSGGIPPTPPMRPTSTTPPGLVAGVILVIIGAALLASRFIDVTLNGITWPLWVVVPGVAMLVGSFFIPPRGGLGLAIPGAIVTTVGLVLWVQAAYGLYATWAYAWALVAPTAPGVAMLLYGIVHRDGELAGDGLRTALVGIGLFLGFALFFEGVIGLSGQPIANLDTVLPYGVIGLGVLLVVLSFFGGGDSAARAARREQRRREREERRAGRRGYGGG